MTKFQGKYRVESTRLPGWDYADPGCYFVTICTKDQKPFFGMILDGVVHLSPMGQVVAEEWVKTEQIRPNVALDEWVIMPDHLHGILVIEQVAETPRWGVSATCRGVSTNPHWKPNTLGAIINQFKSKCTKRIWAAGFPEFGWQLRFYEHLIRHERALNRIRAYIRNNPLKG